MTGIKTVFLTSLLLVMGAGVGHAQDASAQDKSSSPLPWDESVLTDEVPFEDFAKADAETQQKLIEIGEKLFAGRFTLKDGVGRPDATQAIVPTKRRRPTHLPFQRMAGMDANSCASCHNVPFDGGAGDFTANVFVSEGFESADFDTIDPQFSNERGTNSLFGSGLIELLAREMTADLQAQRKALVAEARASKQDITRELVTKGVGFGKLTAHADGTVDVSGLQGVDLDLIIRPFGQKGVFASLRQFTVNALNHHHGIQASERFGAQWTGTADFDGDEVKDEISNGQVSTIVAWQATLKAPARKNDLPELWSTAAARGEKLFSDIGCASCHRPSLPLESLKFTDPSPVENAGTLRLSEVGEPITIDFETFEWVKTLERDAEGRVLVPLFGDLKRHKIADQQQTKLGNELLGQRFVARDVFITAELWGVGNTAPYGHRGDLVTLHEVIDAHGGEAREARKAYVNLEEDARQSIIAFLRSLEVQP